MAPDDEAPNSADSTRPPSEYRGPSPVDAVQGSGDLGLEIEITKMRSAILRAVVELDRFCDAVRMARAQVESMVKTQADTDDK